MGVEVQEASSLEQNRRLMVERQIAARGVLDPRVLHAMRAVPRHRFVPTSLASRAYDDTPLPIGHDQTISQPYIVAYMTEALGLPDDAKVLEIGTGSGYQAAVLAEVSDEVFTIEIVPELAERSTALLDELGYDNVRVRQGDGYRGWPDEAPFDGILVAAAPDHVPPALVEQLAVGARLVIPVGDRAQAMTVVTKTADGTTSETTIPVRFVPMTGEAAKKP
jgi:protein-L-isoaspartate(D-aspartate) O-methyltransferase